MQAVPHTFPLPDTITEKRDAIFADVRRDTVRAALARHADLTDEIISGIAEKAGGVRGMCLVATGGYGRRELAPRSDADLLFLCADAPDADAQKFIENVQRECWGAGLKPSCSVRNLAQCESDMAGDMQFLTALLDRRRVWGDSKIFARLEDVFSRAKKQVTPAAFVAAKLAERDARHGKMGDARYQLQPHVKEGKGALRDIQTLLWIAAYLDLDVSAILTPDESRRLGDAHWFFQAVRCHLQRAAATDRLSFEMQPDIASLMGYADPAPNRRAESFMKSYFIMTNETGHLTRTICADLESKDIKGSRKKTMAETVEMFHVKHFRLNAESFKKPSEIVRIFRVSQTSGLDIHPDASRLIRGEKSRLKNDPDSLHVLFEILLDPKNTEQTLRRMNEADVLAALIPGWENIVARMQYDMYHAYTADEHTLRAVGMLHAIESGALTGSAPLASELFGKIHARRALYAAMLLHDIGKGEDGAHPDVGARAAAKICPALGLNAEETETACWLITHHLLMTMTAYKRDLGDPQTLIDFTAAVQSPERLRLLTLLTTADIMAVGPDKWNNWKSGLLAALYYKAAEALSGAAHDEGSAQFVAAQRQVRRLIGPRTRSLNTLMDHAPPYFWLSFTPQAIASYVEALDEAGDEENDIVRVTPAPDAGTTEVFVYARDRKGLFATLSGAMAAAGASIAEAHIFTLGSGMALDVFHVQTVAGHAYENAAFLKRTIESALSGALDLKAEIAARQKNVPAKSGLFRVEPRVIIDNKASAVSTVIEVNGKDRPGFLHDVTSALSAEGLQISAAKIATFGSRAVDVFYVKDGFGLKILHNQKLAGIEHALTYAIEGAQKGT